MKYGFMILALLGLSACATYPSGEALQVKADQAQLRAIKVSEFGDDDVPPPAQSEIETLKDHLAKITQDYLNSRGDRKRPDAKTVEAGLMVLLDANEPAAIETYQPYKPHKKYDNTQPYVPKQIDGIYGAGLSVKASSPEALPNLLLVKYDFNISCGSDGMVLAYEWQDGAWSPRLRWQAKPYVEISGAFGDGFQIAALPAGEGWHVVSVHGYPWCSSNVSAFNVDVLKPTEKTDAANAIFHAKNYYRRDDSVSLSTSSDGFTAKAEDYESLDGEVLSYPAVFHYLLAGDLVQRVPPLATNPRDFVDQWIQAPWADAQRWSAPGNLPDLQRIYDLLQNRDDLDNSNGMKYFEYGKTSNCGGDRYQVALDWGLWIGENADQVPSQPLYFQVRGKDNLLQMDKASFKTDARCR